MNFFDLLYHRGMIDVKDKNVVFCGMVRDCDKELKHNIPTVEKMASYFSDYRIVISENNSKDNTKRIIREWAVNNKKVIPIINDFDESKYKSIPIPDEYNKLFSLRKLQKYYDYRNIYLDYVNSNIDIDPDYIIEIDYDVAKIDVKGFITSFGNNIEWDAVTANGFSYDPFLRRRYHDTYPLFEYGKDNIPDSVDKIHMYRKVFEPLRKGMPFLRVASAYGGIAIFKANAIKELRYNVLFNNHGGVQVFCDHVSIFRQMKERGNDLVFINPNMVIYYQSISFKLIKKKLKAIIGK